MNISSPSSDMVSIIPSQLDSFETESNNIIFPSSRSSSGSLYEYLTLKNILILVGALLLIYLIYCFVQKYYNSQRRQPQNKNVSNVSEDKRQVQNNLQNNNGQNNNVMYERRVRFADQ